MLELLPLYLRQYAEMKQIMRIETAEMERISGIHGQLVDNRYITTCNEAGIIRFEKLLGITPLSNDTLEDRRLRCITRWNQKLPYNYKVLDNKLLSLLGDGGYLLNMDFAALTLHVKLALGVKNQFHTVKSMIEEMVPCNIVTDIDFMYNTHEMLSTLTYEQLALFTQEAARSEVI